jgi:hypothetical protein
MLQLSEGDYANGWKNFETRLLTHWAYSYMLKSPVPWWQGESLAGKTMLLMPELGFGDDIAYVQYAIKLGERATKEDGLVCLCCWESLETLFARSLAEYSYEQDDARRWAGGGHPPVTADLKIR